MLVLAFTGWGLAVYDGRNVLFRIEVKVDAINARIDTVDQRLDRHEALAGHAGALQLHAEEMTKLDQIRRDVDKLEEREYNAHDESGAPRRKN